MKKFICGLLTNLFLINTVLAQSFNATVNRNPSYEGETIVLTLELKDVDTTDTPDLQSLAKDFTIMSVSNGYRTNIINGNVSKSRQWNLVLIPNQSGEITIPSIELAGYKTQPIQLKILQEGEKINPYNPSVAKNNQTFKMTGVVDNKNPYVQQQITYDLTIYDTGGLQGSAPVFMTNNDDWVIKSLGEPQVKNTVVNGKSQREITFKYALFAQKSGELTVPPVRFEGYTLNKHIRRDPLSVFMDDEEFFAPFGLNDVFSSKTPVALNTAPIKINVKPAEISDGWWLPASKVELSAEFSPSKPNFKVGEPVSRTIVVKADGIIDTQMPNIKFANINDIKQYPEKPFTEMLVENDKVVALSKINNVYIPSKSGELELPEIKLNWFDVKTNTPKIALIPAYKINVAPDTNKQTQQQMAQDTIQKPQSQEQVQATPLENTSTENNLKSIILIIGAFIGGVILTLILLKLFSLKNINRNDYYRNVILFAKQGNIHQLRDNLLLWGKNKYPDAKITNLQDISNIVGCKEFDNQLEKLREFLYSDNTAQWDGQYFAKIFRSVAAQKNKSGRKDSAILPKLYK